MEDKSKKVALSTLICVIIIALLVIAIVIMYFYYNPINRLEQSNTLENPVQNSNSSFTTNSLENSDNSSMLFSNSENNSSSSESSNTIPSNTSSSTTIPKTDREIVDEIVDKFVKAVNSGDLTLAEKYCTPAVINQIKQYKMSNLSIAKFSRYINDTYCYYDSYTLADDISPKDIGLGYLLCVEKLNGQFTITSIGATGV